MRSCSPSGRRLLWARAIRAWLAASHWGAAGLGCRHDGGVVSSVSSVVEMVAWWRASHADRCSTSHWRPRAAQALAKPTCGPRPCDQGSDALGCPWTPPVGWWNNADPGVLASRPVDWSMNGGMFCPALRQTISRPDSSSRQHRRDSPGLPTAKRCHHVGHLKKRKRTESGSAHSCSRGLPQVTGQRLRQAGRGYRAMPIQAIMGTQPQHHALPSSRPPRLQLDRATIALEGRGPRPAACPRCPRCPGVGRES